MESADYIKLITARMKKLDNYRVEYVATIERLATLYVVAENLEAKLADSGFEPVIQQTNRAGIENTVKNPCITACTEIYTQILAHERELGLTPAALKKIGEPSTPTKQKGSALVEALKSLGG